MNRVFIGLGLAMVILTMLGIGSTDPNFERRTLAPWPQARVGTFLREWYRAGVDDYLNDHFALRTWAIESKTWLDWRLFAKPPKHLVIGTDGFVFARGSLELYRQESLGRFLTSYWLDVLARVVRTAHSQGKQVVFVHFRNKELIYRDRLPPVWQKAIEPAAAAAVGGRLPFQRLGRQMRALGAEEIDFTRLLSDKRRSGMEVYAPFHENHPTPEFDLEIMTVLLTEIGRIQNRKVTLPTSYPTVTLPPPPDGEYGYRSSRAIIAPDFRGPVPWRTWTVPNDGGLRLIRQYENPGVAELEETVFYGDSFLESVAANVGQELLPHFRKLTIHQWGTGPEGWEEAKTIVIGIADQSAGWFGHLRNFDKPYVANVEP